MLKRFIRAVVTGAATLAIAAGGLFYTTSAQAAWAYDGHCDSGEICLFYSTNQQDSMADLLNSYTDFGSVTFITAGLGRGQAVKNHADSVWNNTNQTWVIYSLREYKGDAQVIPPGARVNLNSKLSSKNVSMQKLPAGSFQMLSTQKTYTGPNSTYSNGSVPGGSIQSISCYAAGRSVSGDEVWGHIAGTTQWVPDTYINLSGKTLSQVGVKKCAYAYGDAVGPNATRATAAINSAVAWAVSISKDNTIGYKLGADGPKDYDCSSFVAAAWYNAGVGVNKKDYTGNMLADFTANGFKVVASDKVSGKSPVNATMITKGTGLKVGDVVLAAATGGHEGHVVMVSAVSSSGVTFVAARSDSYPRADQIAQQPFFNIEAVKTWQGNPYYVLRYQG